MSSIERIIIKKNIFYVLKTESMCFKQSGTISVLNDNSPKFIDHFTYLGSNISFIESDDKLYIE